MSLPTDTPEQRAIITAEIQRRIEAARKFVRLDRWHRYEVAAEPDRWQTFSGVTSVNKVIDKSDVLSRWAANVQFEADEEVAWKIYSEGLAPGLQRAQYTSLFEARSGNTREHQKRMHAAADLGTQVHDLIEHKLRLRFGLETHEPVVSDPGLYCFGGWEEWTRRVQMESVATEFPVFSMSNRYAGTVDHLAWVKLRARTALRVVKHKPVWVELPAWSQHRLAWIDWKTAAGLYPDMYLQNTAYKEAGIEMGLLRDLVDEPQIGLLVRLPKVESEAEFQDGFEEDTVDPEGDDVRFQVFLRAAGIYPWKKDADRDGLDMWKAKRDVKRRLAETA
jgi:hypothetical protein